MTLYLLLKHIRKAMQHGQIAFTEHDLKDRVTLDVQQSTLLLYVSEQQTQFLSELIYRIKHRLPVLLSVVPTALAE